MPDTSHLTVCIDVELRMQQPRERRPRPPFSPTCSDFHMFFPALSLISSSCPSAGPPGAPALHYRRQHFSAYTSDRVGVPAGGSGGSPTLGRAVNNNLAARPGANCSDRLPPATSYYQSLHAGLLCQVAGHVTHSEENTHTTTHSPPP